ncbi:MAG: LPXTG cell wall anchor domain-containing protein, partial [Christensenellaceae bacterium]|nr:LPXTG cell wall anchor domain-containing protein [Christensenellaceae bacterium]
INFPDAAFRQYIVDNADVSPKDNCLSQQEADAVTDINVDKLGISSIKGIEFFANLKELSCGYNNLSSLDISKNINLMGLDCRFNSLTTLDVSKNIGLKFLCCGSNNLKALDVSKNINLNDLWCWHNNLTSLNLENNKALGMISVHTQIRTVTNFPNNTHVLKFADFNPNIDPNKIINIQGAKLDIANRAFTNVIPGTDIKYDYICDIDPYRDFMDVTIKLVSTPIINPPKTGDNSNLALYIMLLTMSLIVLSVFYMKAKKKK